MKLPGDSIGISDLLAYRSCPRRMSAAMKRHTGDEYPELTNASNAYGSAIHDAISLAEDLDDDAAIQGAFKKWSAWLDPADVERMKGDLATYHDRDPSLGCRTVMNEGEVRVPLMEYGGRTIYFRARLDRLYQRLDNEGIFVHVDYKSSRWAKAQGEVDTDLQMWAYNWIIHEHFPECESLVQHYDQLRHGVVTTSKTDAQRLQIREWLQLAATAVLEDEEFGQDGLLAPRMNKWCPWCPLKLDCPVARGEMTDFSRAMLDLVDVEREGRKTRIKLDADRLNEYVSALPEIETAQRTLDGISKAIRAAIKEMPDSAREELGYGLRERTLTRWGPQELEAVHGIVGEDFYSLVGLSKTSVDRLYGADSDQRTEIERLATQEVGPASIYRRRKPAGGQ